jgi:hypothetical protein
MTDKLAVSLVEEGRGGMNELRRGRTVFDELLYAVGDVKVALVVHSAHVAGLEPPILVKCVLLQIRPVPVSLEDIRSLQQELASLGSRMSAHIPQTKEPGEDDLGK